jgi:hypothetical protein
LALIHDAYEIVRMMGSGSSQGDVKSWRHYEIVKS